MTSSKGASPPIVNIPSDVRRSPHVNEAYSRALDEHGPVIIVPRHGRHEYIIDHRHAKEVLTDNDNFTFEKAALDLLHFGFIAMFDGGRFVHDLDHVVERNVQPRMNAIIERLFPIFDSYFDELARTLPNPADDKSAVEFTDLFKFMQKAIGHAMVILILGPQHSSSETANQFVSVAVAMANMTGMHENTDGWAWFPFLWVLVNGISAVLFSIIPAFFFCVMPALWKTRHEHLQNGLSARHGAYAPLFDLLLAKNYDGKTGVGALFGFVWSAVICVGLIFASIHQTAVAGFWMLIRLAEKQDEYLPRIREQWGSLVPEDGSLDVKTLNQMTLLDSFMREVFRTKGDTWGPIRSTKRPVQIGPYLLPKDAMCMILVNRAHTHPDNYGTEGEKFDGFQWERKGRAAVQSGPEFLSFGMGRWACPGRQLAVNEIKILLYLFFSKFDIQVKEGSVEVLNTINTTSVPPNATIILRRRLR
ncbi:hypothetical protein POX_a01019 [Penicillium oxalicum]|uniref:Cytochrome P450 n=1 Tax=Penicillium oxalicum (strain 114-2 / CGMCC 5302) TaxID=933388 RepID=S7ZU95_PENO1|nr:hypothetical protein POX_a01019 [Penicillium oxalicum]EPS33994.1 hypothetical protein PDE_08956 [Penicillium oxalicum 114-2]KAI2794420.1 hypothetical protein POX_a01019 [Penicillium oxalicum]